MALLQVAQQIADLTRVVHDGDRAAPGVPIHFEVVPGVLPALSSQTVFDQLKSSHDFSTLKLDNVEFDNAAIAGLGPLTGGIAGGFTGKVVGGFTGALKMLTDAPNIVVKYLVTKDGQAVENYEFFASPMLNPVAAASDGLRLSLLLRPEIVDSARRLTPLRYGVAITISVSFPTIDPTIVATRRIDISILLPPLALPTVFLIGRHAKFRFFENGDPGALLVMVRAGAPERDLGALVESINKVADTIYKLTDYAMLFGGLEFADKLALVTELIDRTPYVHLSVGNMGDFEDFGFPGFLADFDDDASCSLLIGTSKSSASIHDDKGFTGNSKRYWANDIILTTPNNDEISTGVGYFYDHFFQDWEFGGGGMNDSASSARFLD